jgi:hypothetical protein
VEYVVDLLERVVVDLVDRIGSGYSRTVEDVLDVQRDEERRSKFVL